MEVTTNRTIYLYKLTTNLTKDYSEKAFAGNFRFPIRRCFGSAEKITARAFSFGVEMKNKYRILPDGKIAILLTQNQETVIDAEDFDLIKKHTWHAQYSSNTDKFYAKTTIRFKEDGKRKSRPLQMQKLLMNPPKSFLVDHKDGDSLNNSRSNLRLATISQNNCNRKKAHKNNLLGLKGVAYRPERKRKFQAHIRVNNVLIHLGSFYTAAEAAKAYNEAAIKYHGEFAALNEI